MRFGDNVSAKVRGLLESIKSARTERDRVVGFDGVVVIRRPITFRGILIAWRDYFEYARDEVLRHLHARNVLERIRYAATAEKIARHVPPLENVNVAVGYYEPLSKGASEFSEHLFR